MHGSASLFVFTGSECTRTSVAAFTQALIILAGCGKGMVIGGLGAAMDGCVLFTHVIVPARCG